MLSDASPPAHLTRSVCLHGTLLGRPDAMSKSHKTLCDFRILWVGPLPSCALRRGARLPRIKHGRMYWTLGQRLAAVREGLGLTQGDVAEATGLGQSAVSRIESGDRRVDPFELRDIALLYGISIEEITAPPSAEEVREYNRREPRPERASRPKKAK